MAELLAAGHLPAGVRLALFERAHPPSMLDELCDLLRISGARVTFDRGASMVKPCTFCSAPAPQVGHALVWLGTYGNGDPIRRPVCSRCMPSAEARGGRVC